MKLELAEEIAERVKGELAPYCQRIEIAGSIRRRKLEVGDIEIVAIHKPYDIGLFESGIATVINKWRKVKGELPCKYTQRILPEGIKLDIFFAIPENWGMIYAIRTGSAEYSHYVLAAGWVINGYKGIDGMLTKDSVPIPVFEEEDLFRIAGVKWIKPSLRQLYIRNRQCF
jgi:DNA polymerase/3'-5' exonuclease PolX